MQALSQGHVATHSTNRKERNIRKVLIKIAQQLDQLPSSLIIRDVQLHDRDVAGCGGYADVFQGKRASAEVAVKRFRLYNRGTEDSVRKVSDLLQVSPSSNVTCDARGYIERFLYGNHSGIQMFSHSSVWIRTHSVPRRVLYLPGCAMGICLNILSATTPH
jgi:hypothetical protein